MIAVSSLYPWIAAALSGVLLFLGYAGFDLFYLEWFFLLPLLFALRNEHPARAFFIGWFAGIVGHTGGFYWIIHMFKQFAGAPLPFAIVGLVLLAAANGVVMAAWAWATRKIDNGAQWHLLWIAPVVWTAVEKLWPQIFPNYLGASQYQLPLLTQVADVTGILGVSFLVVYLNVTLFVAAVTWKESRRIAWRPLAALAVVLLLVTGYGAMRLKEVDAQVAAAKKLTVGLVQTNRGASDTHLETESVIQEHRDMSRELVAGEKPDLVVWPEGVLSVNISSREATLPTSALGDLNTPLLFGSCVQVSDQGKSCVYNSALLADPGGRILGSYDKTVLVPFGEYIPFGDVFPTLYSWSPYSSRFLRGESIEPVPLGDHLLSVSVCYEDIFPLHVRKLMTGGKAGRRPDAMINLTNDSWYGNTTQPVQHLALATFRSIENRRTLVRVTNTGISAFVDPAGRIVKRTGIWTREVLVDQVPLLKGSTPYAAAGDWFGWLCVLITVGGLARAEASRRGRERSGKTGHSV